MIKKSLFYAYYLKGSAIGLSSSKTFGARPGICEVCEEFIAIATDDEQTLQSRWSQPERLDELKPIAERSHP